MQVALRIEEGQVVLDGKTVVGMCVQDVRMTVGPDARGSGIGGQNWK